MHIQINTDKNVEGPDVFSDHMKTIVESALTRFDQKITRIEVHLSDENSDKAGINDKRCLMEARLEGLQPIAVTHRAANPDLAVRGAAEKLKHMIESTLGRLGNH